MGPNATLVNVYKMLSFQGNTAPYLQNAYVRIRSIFRKATAENINFESSKAEIVLKEPAEVSLAKKVAQFAEIVPQILNFVANLKGLKAAAQRCGNGRRFLHRLVFGTRAQVKTPHYLPASGPRESA